MAADERDEREVHDLAAMRLIVGPGGRGAHRMVATCTCGWQTEPMPNAGLAGSALHAHAEAAVGSG